MTSYSANGEYSVVVIVDVSIAAFVILVATGEGLGTGGGQLVLLREVGLVWGGAILVNDWVDFVQEGGGT